MVVQKTVQDYLGEYAGGWASGDAQKILGACAPNYVFQDPDGPVSRDAFADYHARFVAQHGTTMEISGVEVAEKGDQLEVRCRWKAADGLEGTGFIVVGPEGVEREDVVLL